MIFKDKIKFNSITKKYPILIRAFEHGNITIPLCNVVLYNEDNKYKGQMDEFGKISFEIIDSPNNKYIIRLEKPGFIQLEDVIEVNKRSLFQYRLTKDES